MDGVKWNNATMSHNFELEIKFTFIFQLLSIIKFIVYVKELQHQLSQCVYEHHCHLS